MATSVTLKPNAIDISGSTSGTTTLQASAVAGTTTLTLPAATDTLVGKTTTDTLTNKTLTGAAMNGTLGATTPSTASVTTLTTSSTVTHSGGTANGVAYLDGSKVLTTGSALVFDGTNLGVGTSSPAQKFVVSNGGAAGVEVSPTGGSQGGAYLQSYNRSGAAFVATELIASKIGFYTGTSPTLSALLDSAGNLGLGVTPSSFFNTWKVFQLGYSASLSSQTATNIVSLDSNRYQNGSNNPIYIQNGYASSYYQYNGQHVWQTAASGTAGNAITFTQAMTLDASGNLGVAGQTAPSTPLTTGTWGNGLAVGTTTGTNGIVVVSSASSSLSGLRFGDGGTGSQFDQGFVVYDHSADSLILGTSRTERARIDSSGNLLVGASSFADTSNVFRISGSTISSGSSVTTSRTRLEFNNGNGTVGSISTSGSTTTYSTSSDYRLKENIVPMTGALAKVAQLKPVTYTWKADGTSSEGFIAHELQAVVPDAVVGEKDAVNEDGSIKPQGIDTSFLVATLTAAIQELNAKFEEYKATHP